MLLFFTEFGKEFDWRKKSDSFDKKNELLISFPSPIIIFLIVGTK